MRCGDEQRAAALHCHDAAGIKALRPALGAAAAAGRQAGTCPADERYEQKAKLVDCTATAFAFQRLAVGRDVRHVGQIGRQVEAATLKSASHALPHALLPAGGPLRGSAAQQRHEARARRQLLQELVLQQLVRRGTPGRIVHQHLVDERLQAR